MTSGVRAVSFRGGRRILCNVQETLPHNHRHLCNAAPKRRGGPFRGFRATERDFITSSSDAPDFDLWVQVLLVSLDGSTVRLGEDIRRARFRDGFFKQELLKPEQIVEIPFDYWWMARRIPAGARLRLTIAPLNSPNFQKNFNTGGRIGYENIADARIAHIKIFHDAARTSSLTLPLAGPAQAVAK